MQNDVKKKMKWSAAAFNTMIWPVVRELLGGGRLLQMEGRPDLELANKLDMLAGIDGWHIHNNGIRGIASRVQVGKPWNTFTVRMRKISGAKTEFEKRKQAIDYPQRGWIYPAITIQGYIETETGPLLSCGVCLTADLIRFIERGLSSPKGVSDADFDVCPWVKMRKNGYIVKWWTRTKGYDVKWCKK